MNDSLPARRVTHLPPLGSTHRNPVFWRDIEVRNLVVTTHRQMIADDALDYIRARVGAARTPSRSALSRAWKRLDLVPVNPPASSQPVAIGGVLRPGIVNRLPRFWNDIPVREMVIALHRQISMDAARATISDLFGAARTPSRSALGRAWSRMDQEPPRRRPR